MTSILKDDARLRQFRKAIKRGIERGLVRPPASFSPAPEPPMPGKPAPGKPAQPPAGYFSSAPIKLPPLPPLPMKPGRRGGHAYVTSHNPSPV